MLHFFTNSLDPAARRSACGLLNRKGQQGWAELTGREGKPEQRETEQREAEDDHVCHRIHKTRVSHLCLHLFCCCFLVKSDRKEKIYVFYLGWMESFIFHSSGRHPGFDQEMFSDKNKELFRGVLQQATISLSLISGRQMHLCWYVWLLSSTCFWAVTSSWCNKADCRPSPLLSVADQ